jgi:hypothetical protein
MGLTRYIMTGMDGDRHLKQTWLTTLFSDTAMEYYLLPRVKEGFGLTQRMWSVVLHDFKQHDETCLLGFDMNSASLGRRPRHDFGRLDKQIENKRRSRMTNGTITWICEKSDRSCAVV